MPSLFSTGFKIRFIIILLYGTCAFSLVALVNRSPEPSLTSQTLASTTSAQSISEQPLLSIRIESTHDIQNWSIYIDSEKLEPEHQDMRQWISQTPLPYIHSRLIIDTTTETKKSPFALKVSLKTPHAYQEKTYWSEGDYLINSTDLSTLLP